MSERSERVSQARRAGGSSQGGFPLERAIVSATLLGAWLWSQREIERERSERVSQARRAGGSSLGGFLLETAIVPATSPGARLWSQREIDI